MSCAENYGVCLSVPRNRAILTGIVNLVVAFISGLELARGQQFIFRSQEEQKSETTTSNPDEDYDNHFENPHGYVHTETFSAKTDPPSCDFCDIGILILIFATGMSTLLACNTKSHRKLFANLTRACLASCILVSVVFAIRLNQENEYHDTSILFWGFFVQLLFWWIFETYVKEPGLEPVPTGPRTLEGWQKRENETAYFEVCSCCFEICCCNWCNEF